MSGLPIVCLYCHNANRREDIKCLDNCGSLDAYNKAITDALTANNAEWVEWIAVEAAIIRLGDEQNELANGDYVAIPAERWRAHRKEIGL